MYCEDVIYPIEEKRNQLRSQILRRGGGSEEETEILEKYEALLLEKYRMLEQLLLEEQETKKELMLDQQEYTQLDP